MPFERGGDPAIGAVHGLLPYRRATSQKGCCCVWDCRVDHHQLHVGAVLRRHLDAHPVPAHGSDSSRNLAIGQPPRVAPRSAVRRCVGMMFRCAFGCWSLSSCLPLVLRRAIRMTMTWRQPQPRPRRRPHQLPRPRRLPRHPKVPRPRGLWLPPESRAFPYLALPVPVWTQRVSRWLR